MESSIAVPEHNSPLTFHPIFPADILHEAKTVFNATASKCKKKKKTHHFCSTSLSTTDSTKKLN